MKAFDEVHYQILGALSRLGGVPVTIKALLGHIGKENQHGREAVKTLVNDGFINMIGNKISTTIEGAELFQDACDNPVADFEGYYQFRNEVLTGCDSNGHQSTIDTAVLPSNKRYTHNSAGAAHDRVMDLAKRLQLSTDQCLEWIQQGKIRECRRCGIVAVHTMDNGTPKNMCNKCRYIERRVDKND